MRPPRYRFPDEVRSATRTMASRMVRDGTVADTPEQLDDWISREPEFREPLLRGGYGTEFTSDDLFPLLQVFVARAGGSVPSGPAAPRASQRFWLVGLVLVLVAALLAAVVAYMPR
jgi:hypothetical protein